MGRIDRARWRFIAKDRWLARNKATRVPRRPTREKDYAPVRAEFSQAFLGAQREMIRACARAGLPEQEEEVEEEEEEEVREEEEEKEEEADHACTRARAGRSSNSRNFI